MEQYFGSCTNHGECEAACPKSISIDFIALMNNDYLKSKFNNRKSSAAPDAHPSSLEAFVHVGVRLGGARVVRRYVRVMMLT